MTSSELNIPTSPKELVLIAVVGKKNQPVTTEDDAYHIQHVATVAQLERLHHALLDEQDRHRTAAPDRGDRFEDAFHDSRPEALRGLVEQQEIGQRHDAPADSQHLLLATGQ